MQPGNEESKILLKPPGTARLILKELNADDAPFILRLLNEPGWLRFIGDRGVRTPKAARDYLLHGPVEMYRQYGFGLWLVERREGSVPVGICGLIKRDILADIDLGFAFLSEHCGQGYAFEAATATMAYGRDTLGLSRIVAVVSPDNERSIRLLEKLGFGFERRLRLSDELPEIQLYAASL